MRLCHNMIERHLQRLADTEFAGVADHAGFDRAAAYQLDNARDDARMREVHLLNPLMGLDEDIFVVQLKQRHSI